MDPCPRCGSSEYIELQDGEWFHCSRCGARWTYRKCWEVLRYTDIDMNEFRKKVGTAALLAASLLLTVLPLAAQTVQRDVDGRIHRSERAKIDFAKMHPCPSTGESRPSCPGYVIDHVCPLSCGGKDSPFNMQWQTVAEGKAKDKIERKQCAKFCGKKVR